MRAVPLLARGRHQPLRAAAVGDAGNTRSSSGLPPAKERRRPPVNASCRRSPRRERRWTFSFARQDWLATSAIRIPTKCATSLDCESCHAFETWANPPKNGYHQLAGFSLDGAHTSVACEMCHDGESNQRGRGERCGSCHAQDDVHVGSIGADCGRCHNQQAWLPSSTFTHTDVGLILQGVHRLLDCRSCHQAGNYFISDQCLSCHMADFRASRWHMGVDGQGGIDRGLNLDSPDGLFFIFGAAQSQLNNPNASTDCGACHNQFAWEVGVRSVP